jgi:hypothetical protein
MSKVQIFLSPSSACFMLAASMWGRRRVERVWEIAGKLFGKWLGKQKTEIQEREGEREDVDDCTSFACQEMIHNWCTPRNQSHSPTTDCISCSYILQKFLRPHPAVLLLILPASSNNTFVYSSTVMAPPFIFVFFCGCEWKLLSCLISNPRDPLMWLTALRDQSPYPLPLPCRNNP